MVVLAVAIAAHVRDEGSGENQTAIPPSTLAPSTTIGPTTIGPTTIVPTTIQSAPASTLRPPEAIPPISFGPGPVLGVARGWSLVSFNQITLALLDLDTGTLDAFSYQLGRFLGGVQSPIMLSDRFVYTSSGLAPSVWSQRYGPESPKLVLDEASILIPSSTPGLFWVALHQDGVDGRQQVREIDHDGRVLTSLGIPAGLRVVGGGANGLWLSGSGRIYSMTRSGALQAIAVGTVIDASVTGVLFDDCAIAGPCSLRFASTASSAARIGPTAEIHTARRTSGSDPALSPNGRWLSLASGVLDRRTGGQLSHGFVVQSWRWSPDGDLLFMWTSSEGVIAWDLAQARQIRLGDYRVGTVAGVVAR